MTPRRLPNAFSLLAIALVLVAYFSVFGDLDWTWQVRTGEVIVQTGTLRISDTFSYTIHGQPLHDFEWLYEVLLYLTWNAFGIGGLKFLKVLCIFTPLALLAWRLTVGGVKWHGILVCLALAVFCLTPAWNLRPLYVTTIGLLLLSGLLHDHCTGRRPLPWWTPLLMLLWANMHPGVITGQGLLFGVIAWEWLNRGLKWNKTLEPGALSRLTLIGGLALLATFVCPDPIERLRYTFKPELSHPIMRMFVEMMPTFSLLSEPPYTIAPVYPIALLVLLTVILRFRAYRAWELALLAGTAFLGNYAYRGMMDWLLIWLAFGVPHLKELLAAAARFDRRRWFVAASLRIDRRVRALLNSPVFGFQTRYLVAAVGLLFVVSILPPLSRRMPIENSHQWPVAALDVAERAGLHGRYFGSVDHGAYVGWRLKENGLAYADTRGFFFPPLLLEDTNSIPQLHDGWRGRLKRVLDEYRTDYFLLNTQGPLAKLWLALQPHVGPPLHLDDRTVLLSAAQVRAGVARMDEATAQARGE